MVLIPTDPEGKYVSFFSIIKYRNYDLFQLLRKLETFQSTYTAEKNANATLIQL